MQIHFAAVIRHGIRLCFLAGGAGIVASCQKIAAIVVALEETVEMVVQLGVLTLAFLRGLVFGEGLLHLL
ncbi:MAG: hypothetical protein HZC43_10490 [Nitrosomonadales bacterium]|nr:hypothetical protein [Nitrosomonadales bacterium]